MSAATTPPTTRSSMSDTLAQLCVGGHQEDGACAENDHQHVVQGFTSYLVGLK